MKTHTTVLISSAPLLPASAARCRRCLLPLWEPSNILRGVCAGCWDAGMEVRLAWAAGGTLVGAAITWWLR